LNGIPSPGQFTTSGLKEVFRSLAFTIIPAGRRSLERGPGVRLLDLTHRAHVVVVELRSGQPVAIDEAPHARDALSSIGADVIDNYFQPCVMHGKYFVEGPVQASRTLILSIFLVIKSAFSRLI